MLETVAEVGAVDAACLTCGFYVFFWQRSREGCAWGQQSMPPCKEERENNEEEKTATTGNNVLFMRDMSHTCVDADECIGKLTLSGQR